MIGALFTGVETQKVKDQEKNALIQSFVIGLTVVLIMLAVMFIYVTRRVVVPIKDLGILADDIAAGKLGKEVTSICISIYFHYYIRISLF